MSNPTINQLHLEAVAWREFQEKWWGRIRGMNGPEHHALQMALHDSTNNGNASHCKKVFLRRLEGVEGTLAANARREAENHLPF